MGLLFIVIFILIAIGWYKCSAEQEAQEKKDAEKNRAKRKEAIKNGKSYYIERWDDRGELRVDVNTGERYREKFVGCHLCRFDQWGHLKRDLTKEQLEKNLGGERARAIKEGRRLYMSDNREMFAHHAKSELEGVWYKDIVTGSQYVLGQVGGCCGPVLLFDVKTHYAYDVLKHKDGRKYLEIPNECMLRIGNYSFDNLKEYIEWLNWDTLHEPDEIKRATDIYKIISFGYVDGIYEGYPEDPGSEHMAKNWRNMLNVDVRDEFKNAKEFPIVIAERDPRMVIKEEHARKNPGESLI